MIYWTLMFCVTFIAEGAKPVFDNLPVHLYIGENEVTNRLIYHLSVYDPDGDLFTCALTRIKSDSTYNGCPTGSHCPNEDELTLLRNPSSGVYELDIAGVPPAQDVFYLSEDYYRARIVCRDENNDRRTSTARVHINAGQNVWWDTPLPSTVIKNAKTFGVNSLVETAQASNTQGIPMTYKLIGVSPNPAGTNSYFSIDPNSGEIRNLQDLYTVPFDYGPAFFLDVQAVDANNELTIYGRVTLILQNQNIRPVTYSLPLADTLSEATPVGTTLFTLNVINPEADQTVTTMWNCNPSAGNAKFTLDGSNNFILSSSLDYDTDIFYQCTFSLNDGFHDSLSTYTYQLSIFKENTPPKFDSTMYYATFTEGEAGTISTDPELRCTDSESTVTYSLLDVANSSRFGIDPNTGVLKLAIDYNVDGVAALPAVDILTVYCTDIEDATGIKYTATSQITVAINDANDSPPELPQRGYLWYSNNTMNPGNTVIGTLFPSDADNGANAQVTCSASSSSVVSSYYSMSSSCELFLTRTIDFEPGTPVRYIVLVSDLGNPSLATTATIDVIYRDISTTTTTSTNIDTTPYSFWDHDRSIVVFTLTLLGAAGLLGLGLYVYLRIWMFGSDSLCPRCDFIRYKKFSPAQITPVTPPRTPPPRERRPQPQRAMMKMAVIRPGFRPVRPAVPPRLLQPRLFPF